VAYLLLCAACRPRKSLQGLGKVVSLGVSAW